MLSALILSTVLSQQATCQSAYGQTACGYNCVAAYGTIKCSQVPEGSCAAAYGQVTCFDPPRRHRGRFDGVRSECKSAYGMTACGYSCVAAYGVVRCAQSPQGTCVAQYGQVTCFDPR